MKKLRVLTGRHAGSELVLDSPMTVISANPEHDIQINDWVEQPLTLYVHDDGSDNPPTSFRLGSEEADVMIWDFAPRAFGPVALCVGPGMGEWPTDLELIERMLRPAAWVPDSVPMSGPQVEPQRAVDASPDAPRKGSIYAAAAVVAAALLGTFAYIVGNQRPEPPPPTPLALAVKVLQRFELPEVSVRSEGSGVVVEGLVPDTATMNRLRQALSGLPTGTVKERLASSSDIAQTITDTLGLASLSVHYQSRGRFLVQGSAVDAKSLNAKAERLANELKPLVSGITLAVEDLPLPPRMPTGAMMAGPGVEYVQARDGTKHIALVHRLDETPSASADFQFPQPRNSDKE